MTSASRLLRRLGRLGRGRSPAGISTSAGIVRALSHGFGCVLLHIHAALHTLERQNLCLYFASAVLYAVGVWISREGLKPKPSCTLHTPRIATHKHHVNASSLLTRLPHLPTVQHHVSRNEHTAKTPVRFRSIVAVDFGLHVNPPLPHGCPCGQSPIGQACFRLIIHPPAALSHANRPPSAAASEGTRELFSF